MYQAGQQQSMTGNLCPTIQPFQSAVKSPVLFKLTLCKISHIFVLTTSCCSGLFRGGRTAPALAAVHRRAGALQSAPARGERGESVVGDCEATLWTGGLVRAILRLLVSWYLL